MIDKDYPVEVIAAAQYRYYKEYDYKPFCTKRVNFQDILDEEYAKWRRQNLNDS